MTTYSNVERDERTEAFENASYKWAYYFLAFALLLDAAFRSQYRHESVGDLVALAGASAVIGMVYLVRHDALVSYWPWKWRRTLVVFATCILVAMLISIMAIVL